jgi:hypothetical protein
MHFEESCFTTLSIVHCFSLKTTFRKLDLLLSSSKKGGQEVAPTLWGLLERALSNENHRVGATPSTPPLPEDGSTASSRNVVFKEKHWTMDKVLKQDSSKSIRTCL